MLCLQSVPLTLHPRKRSVHPFCHLAIPPSACPAPTDDLWAKPGARWGNPAGKETRRLVPPHSLSAGATRNRESHLRSCGVEPGAGGQALGPGSVPLSHRDTLASPTHESTQSQAVSNAPKPHRHPSNQDTSTHTCEQPGSRPPKLPKGPAAPALPGRQVPEMREAGGCSTPLPLAVALWRGPPPGPWAQGLPKPGLEHTLPSRP